MKQRPPPKRLIILAIAAFLTLVVALSQFGNFSNFKHIPDAEHYIAMAKGESQKALMPYARRILHPWIVGKLGLFMNLDIAFFVVGTLSVFFFLYIVTTILFYDVKIPLSASIAFIYLPYLFYLYRSLYLPAIFFLCLTSLYWFLLLHRRYWISLLVLFLLLLAREEALVISVSFLLASIIHVAKNLRDRKWYIYISTAIIIIILSQIIMGNISASSMNTHNIPAVFSFFLRIPAYFFRNFLGLLHWVDTFPRKLGYVDEPILIFEAPHWLKAISSIKQWGIYKWDANCLIRTYIITLSVFGTGPIVVLFFLKRIGRKIIGKSVPINTILFSGCILFILSPVMGLDMIRYYVTAWPLFFILLPFLLKQIRNVDNAVYAKIIASYIICAWLLFLWWFPFEFNIPRLIFFLGLIMAEIGLYCYSWRLLSVTSKKICLTIENSAAVYFT
ncbi:MAG: hypothetical protein JSW40_02875 [Candidatus Omnitrophota bacterium]|nr:MAG: hypothetical protein JSW40_02875 [Candidatus Omnitrophota bacterium]